MIYLSFYVFVYFWILRSFQILISDAAIQAFLLVAIFFLQLDECLAVSGMGDGQPTLAPHADDVVVFGFQFFQKGGGTPAQFFLALTKAVGIEESDDGVDNQQIERRVAQGLQPHWCRG